MRSGFFFGIKRIGLGSILGFSDSVHLKCRCAAINTGIQAVLSDSVVTPEDSVMLFLLPTQNPATGNYEITITGSSSTGMHKTTTLIQLINGAPSVPILNFPPDTALGISTKPVFSWDSLPDAFEYQLEIAQDPSFSNIIQIHPDIRSSSYQLDSLLDTYSIYFWRITAVNPCGATYSPTYSFLTAGSDCNTFVSQNVPISIPTQVSSIQSSVSIADSGKIQSLRVVSLRGTHSWINDLIFTLTSPSGRSITLIDQICESQDDFDINLDDQGLPYFNIPCPPVDGGTYQPLQRLDVFAGEEMQGVWTLTVEDLFNNDGGSLNGWGLEICYDIALPCTLGCRGSQQRYQLPGRM